MVEVTMEQEEAVERQDDKMNGQDLDTEQAAVDEMELEEMDAKETVDSEAGAKEQEEDSSPEQDGEKEAFDAADKVAGGKRPSEKKKGSSKSRKDKKDKKIEELNDRLMRNLAEFENFRNRSEREKGAMFEMGAKSVIEKMIPVVDNLERGFDGLSDEEKETPFVKGIEAVYKQLQAVFEELGVVPIEAIGQEFDPNLHNAVMHDEDDSGESNKVIEEFQKGYMYKDSVVRHSMVKVLN